MDNQNNTGVLLGSSHKMYQEYKRTILSTRKDIKTAAEQEKMAREYQVYFTALENQVKEALNHGRIFVPLLPSIPIQENKLLSLENYQSYYALRSIFPTKR